MTTESHDTVEFLKANNRSIRRHHLGRIKHNRAQYWGYTGQRGEAAMPPRCLGIVSSTPQPCSCVQCANPRRAFDERTVQEQRAMQRERVFDTVAEISAAAES